MSPKDPEHDYAVVWTRPEGVLPSFAQLLEFDQVDDEALLADVDRFASLLSEGLRSYPSPALQACIHRAGGHDVSSWCVYA